MKVKHGLQLGMLFPHLSKFVIAKIEGINFTTE